MPWSHANKLWNRYANARVESLLRKKKNGPPRILSIPRNSQATIWPSSSNLLRRIDLLQKRVYRHPRDRTRIFRVKNPPYNCSLKESLNNRISTSQALNQCCQRLWSKYKKSQKRRPCKCRLARNPKPRWTKPLQLPARFVGGGRLSCNARIPSIAASVSAKE